MTGRPQAAPRDPVADWFRRSGRRAPPATCEVRAALLGGVLALRTNSAAAGAYLRERCALLAAGRNRAPAATAEIRCLRGPGWPAVNPGEPSAALRGKKSSGVFHSFGGEGLTCVWRAPALMGCAFPERPPEIRMVATPIDPRLCRRPPGGLRIKCSGAELELPEVWDLALCLFARLRGVSIFHGAVLGKKDRGILLTGAAGSGKTTAALALVRGGYRLLTDEYAALWRRGRRRGLFGGVLVPPMFVGGPPGSLKTLEETMGAAATSKSAFAVRPAWTRRAPVELRSIVVLARPAERIPAHRAVPMDKFELLSDLMAQLLDPVRGDRADLLETLLEVVEQVPAHRVEAGTDLKSLPAFVEQLAAGKGRKSGRP